jgi:hypothetical protein
MTICAYGDDDSNNKCVETDATMLPDLNVFKFPNIYSNMLLPKYLLLDCDDDLPVM